MSATPGLSTIGQIALHVKDLERAIIFYRDTLGLTFLFQVPNLAFFDCNGIRLMLELDNGQGERFNALLYYKVDDIQASYQALQQLNVQFEENGGAPHKIADMPDHELWMAFCRDSEGNLLALMCEVRNA